MLDQRLVIGGVILVVILAAGFFLFRPSAPSIPGTPGIPGGANVIYFAGQPIPLTPVSGEDIPCIGAPEGFTRGYYSKDDTYHKVGYYFQGNKLRDVESWIRDRARTCGYELTNRNEGAAAGVEMVTLDFEKDDAILTVDIGMAKANDGKVYTLVLLSKENLNIESYNEEESPTEEEGTQTSVSAPEEYRWLNDDAITVFKKVFGNAYLKNWTSGAMIGVNAVELDYGLGRETSSEDADKVANAFRELGYSVQGMSNDNGTTIYLTKEGYWIIVSFDWGVKEVIVSLTQGGG